MNVKTTVLFLLLICFSNSTFAQEKPELFSNIQRVVQEKEPTWKVEQIYPGNTTDPRTQSIVFRSGEGRTSVDVSVWRREKDALDVFAAHAVAFDNTMGKGMVKSSLPKLGDENHIWTNRGSEAWPTIKFRKGNINVTVFAPSVVIAQRFAQHVFSHITGNHVAGVATVQPVSLAAAGHEQGSINQDVPGKIDARARYLFYLHGRIIEDQGIRAVHERHGVYEYQKILETFKAANLVVVSEARAKDTDNKVYAAKVVAQINELLKAGVSPRHITVVGASKGAGITMYTSSLLKHRDVNFVIMGGCGEQTLKNTELNLYGNVLSIYDASDEGAGTCETLFGRAGGLNRRKEVKINLGLGHGFLYRPHREWIEPAIEWAKQS